MIGNVTGFPGVKLVDAPIAEQPVAEIVTFIEELLAAAKRGQIRAIGVAYVKTGDVTADGFASGNGTSHSLFAAVADLFHTCAARRHSLGTYVDGENGEDS